MKKTTLAGLCLVIFLVIFLVSIYWGNKVKEDKPDPDEQIENRVSCYDYIISVMDDFGWMKTGDEMMFTNKDDHYFVWNLSSSVFTYMEKQMYVYIINEQIFANGDFHKNLYSELKDETDFDELKKLVDDVHEKFVAKSCPIKGKDSEVLNEEYQEKYID